MNNNIYLFSWYILLSLRFFIQYFDHTLYPPSKSPRSFPPFYLTDLTTFCSCSKTKQNPTKNDNGKIIEYNRKCLTNQKWKAYRYIDSVFCLATITSVRLLLHLGTVPVLEFSWYIQCLSIGKHCSPLYKVLGANSFLFIDETLF